ncbi:hypothetical protein [Actinoplanes sp. GCM10030250]|uniref:hypothetical protein n=1 Tax=Actinoplanes sp. GCM10030250 TaxID=3273376 RepID=UPI00361B96AA
MFPRTPLALTVGALLLTAACGEPPEAPPSVFPVPVASSPAASTTVPADSTMPPVATMPVNTVPTVTVPPYTTPAYTVPGYATPPPQGGRTTTTPTSPLTKSPTPTPTHAAKCSGEPTAAQILRLIKDDPGVPKKVLEVAAGPYCSGTWAFTTVRIKGQNADQAEPLMVSSTGKGDQLTLVAAGTDVCNARMQTEAPAGIRVLACGL